MRRVCYAWVTEGNRDTVLLIFHLCTLIPITPVLELTCGIRFALLSVEDPDGEGDLSMLRHSGSKTALLFCESNHRESLFPGYYLFILWFFLLYQGERGLDGFPGKPGETGEQVSECWGCWAMVLDTGTSEPLYKHQLHSSSMGTTVVQGRGPQWC